ncbi:hypothetical protein TEA_007048 [Camellia sinensis var. sinensis]|uniref:Glycosyltransferase N-terminal domain-containing protein n=1 Tax=Camellia sinensis var. sinensis TaxID=542762 RepID=A0A4S4ERH7_CAMSN|nr:hypothetical protein TEA_007048 [Camellia sinensis var. sinensis]
MGSQRSTEKPSPPHAVCIPFPAQGHINPMLKLAKLLNHKGFHITFINTEFNHRRLLKSRGPNSLAGTPSFRFETIPDGLPPTDNAPDATQDVPSLCDSTRKNCLVPFRDLIAKINHTASSKVPPVSCIVSDGIMSFTVLVAQELGIPDVLFWTTSACGFMGYVQYRQLIEKDLTPLKVLRSSKGGSRNWLESEVEEEKRGKEGGGRREEEEEEEEGLEGKGEEEERLEGAQQMGLEAGGGGEAKPTSSDGRRRGDEQRRPATNSDDPRRRRWCWLFSSFSSPLFFLSSLPLSPLSLSPLFFLSSLPLSSQPIRATAHFRKKNHQV